MYQFNKKPIKGTWRFELNGISLLINGFFIKDEKHWIKSPSKAIGFFNIDNNLYSVSNSEPVPHHTIEDFYDALVKQHKILKSGRLNSNNEDIKMTA